MSGMSGSNSEYIIIRQRIVRKLLKEGLSCSRISKRLSKTEGGKYAATKSTVQRDIRDIRKKRVKWDKIHVPHQMEIAEAQRTQLISDLDHLIKEAGKKRQFKTAGDLIAKKARLLGIDKFVAPKGKKKDDIADKYKDKSQNEVNEILFQEFKELAASILRLVKKSQFSNIVKMTIRIVRKDEDSKLKKYIITRFGDEKNTYRIQDELKKQVKRSDNEKDQESEHVEEDSGDSNKDILDL